MEGLYLGLICTIAMSSIVMIAVLQAEKINKSIKIILLGAVMLFVFFQLKRFVNNAQEYHVFNAEKYENITSITINNEELLENQKAFFEELKTDDVSFLNHPIVEKSYHVNICTKHKTYRFRIEKTSNQGVLVKRIDSLDKDMVSNRNDHILRFINPKP